MWYLLTEYLLNRLMSKCNIGISTKRFYVGHYSKNQGARMDMFLIPNGNVEINHVK